jgi:hypothetical protein
MLNALGGADLLDEIEAWPLVFRFGEITICQNPAD